MSKVGLIELTTNGDGAKIYFLTGILVGRIFRCLSCRMGSLCARAAVLHTRLVTNDRFWTILIGLSTFLSIRQAHSQIMDAMKR